MNYPVITVDSSKILSYEKRDKSFNYIEYRLNYDDINTFPGFVYEFLAMKFYGKRVLWYKIFDINPLVFPDELEEGMSIKIPLISTSNLNSTIVSYDRGLTRQPLI